MNVRDDARSSVESDPRWRYRNDAEFHRLTDMFEVMISQCQFSPSEIRAALMLALYMVEARNPGPTTYRLENFAQYLIEDQRKRG